MQRSKCLISLLLTRFSWKCSLTALELKLEISIIEQSDVRACMCLCVHVNVCDLCIRNWGDLGGLPPPRIDNLKQ